MPLSLFSGFIKMSAVKDYAEKHQCGLMEAVRAVAVADKIDTWTRLSQKALYARDLGEVKGILQEIIYQRLEELKAK